MAYLPIAFSAAFLDGNADPIAGATVTMTIRNAAGVAVVTSGAATERTGESGSYYEYIYTPVADTTYTAVASTNHASALQNWLLVGSATAEQDNSGGGLTAEEVWEWPVRTLTSPTLTFQAPFGPDAETLNLVRGDTYSDGVDNRPLQWSSAAWPVLTGGSVVLLMRSVSAPNDIQSFAGTIESATAVQVELTAAQTAVFDVSSNVNQPAYHYTVVATLSDGGIVTLVRGNVIVRKTALNL